METYRHAGMTFEVRDAGPADGEPVVLLHGFPQDGGSWMHVEARLHDAGLRTLAPTMRGYSSGARPSRRRDYAIDTLVDDVIGLLDAAALESAHVVGHDWGGMVAWAMAGTRPDRVRTLTVLSTPHPRAFRDAFTSSRQGLMSWYMLAFQVPWAPERILPGGMVATLRRTGLPREFARRYAARMQEPGAMRCALNYYRGMPFWITRPFPRVKVPTAYVYGSGDPFLGASAAAGTAGYVTGDYDYVELEAGHWLPETHPDDVARAVVDRVAVTPT